MHTNTPPHFEWSLGRGSLSSRAAQLPRLLGRYPSVAPRLCVQNLPFKTYILP